MLTYIVGSVFVVFVPEHPARSALRMAISEILRIIVFVIDFIDSVIDAKI